jgi:hypothetical protein
VSPGPLFSKETSNPNLKKTLRRCHIYSLQYAPTLYLQTLGKFLPNPPTPKKNNHKTYDTYVCSVDLCLSQIVYIHRNEGILELATEALLIISKTSAHLL